MISPSLLSADFMRLAEEIEAIEEAGADMLHLDIMDGHFVPNITFGAMIVKQIHKITRLPLDVHLMIEKPERYIPHFADAGADIITVHAEATVHLHRLLGDIRERGAKAGVSLNPSTSLSTIEEVTSMLDLVLVMTVNPGFGGQTFIREGVDKVARLKLLLESMGNSPLIEIDGGVNAETAPLLWEAGADILVAGSYVFGSADYATAINSIRRG
ncbi:MAG: ribulose-phosphate 3-epimerase [Deferribacteraceae bacterium]|nr:ribulose-phosphate 3-epimerase [Deferribacteraceae bacterium]